MMEDFKTVQEQVHRYIKFTTVVGFCILCLSGCKSDTGDETLQTKDEKGDSGRIEVTVFSCTGEYGFIGQMAEEFNLQSEEYIVKVVPPVELAEGMDIDSEDVQMKIQLAITGSNAADLIDISELTDWEKYARKGYFSNLSTFVEESTVINKDDYIETVYNFANTDGRQIFIPYAFTIHGYDVLKSNYGENNWSVSNLITMAEEDDSTSLSWMETKTSALNGLMGMSISEFVNLENCTCNFDNDLFLKILEYSNSCPNDSKSYEIRDDADDYLIYRDCLVFPDSLMGAKYYKDRYCTETDNINGAAKDSIIFAPYPSSNNDCRYGCNLSMNSTLAILENSDAKEGAWKFIEFVSVYFREDYNALSFFARKDWYEKQLADNGLTDKEQEELNKIIDGSFNDKFRKYYQIEAIISEEAQYYFENVKTKEEVADIIQSRVQLYLNQ